MASAFQTEMGVLPELAKAIEEMEWNLPTDIQNDAIPLILGGGDVLMAAETGSGKTGAFCLPVLQVVYESLLEKDKKKPIIVKSNTWKMNVFDRTASMAIDKDGTLCQSRDKSSWHSCRADKGVHGPGKYYFEATVTDDGLCRVGWSTKDAKMELGTCAYSFGFGGTGKKSHCKNFENYGDSFTLKDTIGNCIDFDNNEIRWYKNGVDLKMAYKIPTNLTRETFFPALSVKNAEIRFNFGDDKAAPGGYLWINKAVEARVNSSSLCGSDGMMMSKNDNYKIGPMAIIIEPSRELAEQTFKQISLFKKYLIDKEVRVSLIVGGANSREQQNEINRGTDIIVATPGRLQDLINGNMLSVHNVRFFVLDECDGLLSQGNKQLIMDIHGRLNKIGNSGVRLQMIVCSATLHSLEVKKLADSIMQFPTWVDLKGEDSVPDTVHHVVCMLDPCVDTRWHQWINNKNSNQLLDGVHECDQFNSTAIQSPELLSQAIKILKIQYVIDCINNINIDNALIFCRTKLDCDQLEMKFKQLGGGPSSSNHKFSCVCLHSDRKPDERKANLEKFKNKSVRFMICTDVAARGLDIKGLPFVINMTLPDEKENYVHRIGRVGRAERMGLAISLVSRVKEKVWYHSNCTTRGKNCYNTKLVEQKGCCIWYNEGKLLGDIEEHLGVIIDQTDNKFNIQINEFDGKVVYGEKMSKTHNLSKGHVDILGPAVRELAALQKQCQENYLTMLYDTSRVL